MGGDDDEGDIERYVGSKGKSSKKLKKKMRLLSPVTWFLLPTNTVGSDIRQYFY